MSEPVFDPGASPVACPGCGQRVVLVALPGEPSPACPVCHGREASALSREEGAVPAGPWPRLVLRRGPSLAGGAFACALVGSEQMVEAPEGVLGRLRRDGASVVFAPLVAGARVDGAEVAPGSERELRPGSRVSIAGRELTRA